MHSIIIKNKNHSTYIIIIIIVQVGSYIYGKLGLTSRSQQQTETTLLHYYHIHFIYPEAFRLTFSPYQ